MRDDRFLLPACFSCFDVCHFTRVKMLRVSSLLGSSAKKRKQYRTYSPTRLNQAYLEVTENGASVYKAAKMYSVPEQTLRDRTIGTVQPETTRSGPGPLFTLDEEAKLVEHVKLIASVVYGYTRAQVIEIGTEYAIHLNKKVRGSSPLSLQWFYGFMGRWPELKLRKPRTITQLRATATSEESITAYFDELRKILIKYDLERNPERIYNMDEKGINLTHSVPLVVSSAASVPFEICPEKSSTTTILGCGNALGEKIPPYFVFPGARMRQDLLEGKSLGADGTVTDSGWSNSEVFQNWLTNHFAKYAKVGLGKTLLLYDGHRSHISPHLIEIANTHGIVLFVLPPHTSHVLQPMDVGCFGPFTKIFGSECRKWQYRNSGTVNRYNVCELACKAYELSLSAKNLQSAIRKCGIHPFDPSAIDRSFLQPSTFSKTQASNKPDKSTEPVANTVPNHPYVSPKSPVHPESTLNFFSSHLPEVSVKAPKQRRSIHKIVGGKPITEPTISSQITSYLSSSSTNKSKPPSVSTATTSKQKPKNAAMSKQKPKKFCPPFVQSTLHLVNSEMSESESDEETCCVCEQFQPEELKQCVSVVFTKWGQCMFDNCHHWVHLKYCCDVTVLRRHDIFYCPCHGLPCKVQEE